MREHGRVEFLRCWCAITLRRNRRELVGIVALLGVLGGVSLFALAGARRTQSSYPRFLRASQASTMAIDPGQYDPTVDRAIASRPEVLRSTSYVAFNTAPLVKNVPDFNQNFETLGTFDGRFFTMDRFALLRGRLPNPDRDDEIAVNEAAADHYGYHVGQHLDLGTYSAEQLNAQSLGDLPPPMIRRDSTIVGIGLFVDEVVQDDINRSPLALVTPAFTKEAAAWATYSWQGLMLRHGDADVPAVKAWYLAQVDPGTPQFFRVTSVDTFHAQQAIRPLSMALASFGGIAFVATLVLVSQAVNRRLRRGRAEQTVLVSMGASARTLVVASFFGPALAVVVGALVAVGLAYVASPLMPIGVVRRVEVTRGLDADWTVFGQGAATFVVILALVATVSAVRGLPRRRVAQRSSSRRSRVVGMAARSGLSPAAVTGLRRAFQPGDGTTAVPVRSVILAGIISIATIAAALTFGASFRDLLHSPSLYGWNWDSTIFDSAGYGNLNSEGTHQLLDGQPEIAGWSGAYFGADSIDGANVPLMGMELGSTVTPPLLHGQMIAAHDEVVLGPATASALGKKVGDTVAIGVGTNTTILRVVGIATFPTIGILHGARTSLGVGALVVPDLVPGFDRQAAGNGPPGTSARPVGPPAVFVRFTPGANRSKAAALVEKVAAATGEYAGSAEVVDPQRPAEIVNSSNVGGVPTLLALVLGVATAISLTVTLAASVQRRRGELALLQAIGFTRRQVGSSVMWQSTATIVVGLLIGIPVGTVLGRQLWAAFADQLDVVPNTSIPLVWLGIVAIIAIVAADVAAAVPARIARRVQPASTLRSG